MTKVRESITIVFLFPYYTIRHWPVDHYQSEGLRETSFLTDNVIKYHRTISTYINDLIGAGFRIKAVKEPVPSEEMIKRVPGMKD